MKARRLSLWIYLIGMVLGTAAYVDLRVGQMRNAEALRQLAAMQVTERDVLLEEHRTVAEIAEAVGGLQMDALEREARSHH